MKILIRDREYLPAAAKKILSHKGNSRIFAFHGSLGAGKTTMIKAICKVLGSPDIVTSPTFTIVNEYRTHNGEIIYHVDFYRISNIKEVYDIGFEEYLSGDSFLFIEWPEMVKELLPAGTVNIYISVMNNNQRILEVS